ncbi:MAG: DUF1080 domain-containing protein [Opitutae bacterium]|nr:DUF1080 domain-containing protein [Opitutae bacterium]
MHSSLSWLLALTLTAGSAFAADTAPNTLTPAESKAGWRLLWDGQTTKGWRSLRGAEFPAKGWEIKDGALTVLSSGGKPGTAGGDIITTDKFTNFELSVDFKITPGANSGIKYFIDPAIIPNGVGFEFQVLDDTKHPDAQKGTQGNRTIGSLYDLIAAAGTKKVNPPGQWNNARIVVQGRHVEHWLNGEKVVALERLSDDFRKHLAESKFKSIAKFGEVNTGHILLQEHGDEVAYRNIKLRELPAQ